MNGGSITNTSGAGGTTAGLFTVGDPISGYGTISGNVAITAGNFTASGGTLTLNGVQLGSSGGGPGLGTSSGGTFDLQGNITLPTSANMNPGGNTVKLDGTTISGPTGSSHFINNSGLTTSGTFDVVNASTLNNIAFSTGNGANLVIDAPLTVQQGSTVNATNVTINGTGGLSLLNTTGTTALTTNNFTMAKGALLNVGAGTNGISITGNFSFQQTNPSNWTIWRHSGSRPGSDHDRRQLHVPHNA